MTWQSKQSWWIQLCQNCTLRTRSGTPSRFRWRHNDYTQCYHEWFSKRQSPLPSQWIHRPFHRGTFPAIVTLSSTRGWMNQLAGKPLPVHSDTNYFEITVKTDYCRPSRDCQTSVTQYHSFQSFISNLIVALLISIATKWTNLGWRAMLVHQRL